MGQASGGHGFLGLCWSFPSQQWQEALGSQGFTGLRCVPIPGSMSSPGAFLLEVPPEVRLEDKSHPVAPPESLPFSLGSLLLTPGPGPAFCSQWSNICCAHQCLSSPGPLPMLWLPWIKDNFLPRPGSKAGWGCAGDGGGVCVCVNAQHGILPWQESGEPFAPPEFGITF